MEQNKNATYQALLAKCAIESNKAQGSKAHQDAAKALLNFERDEQQQNMQFTYKGE